jgi:hypothetical protein
MSKKIINIFAFSYYLMVNSIAFANECRVSCAGNSAVKVDLGSRCMCLGWSCFSVDIGYGGPSMTTQGTGRMVADVRGAKYQTRAVTTSGIDNDAIRMGIPENDKYGKWIHKTRGCVTPGGGLRTAGCVGVPCEWWPKFKAMAPGQELTVCGGGALASRANRTSRTQNNRQQQPTPANNPYSVDSSNPINFFSQGNR